MVGRPLGIQGPWSVNEPRHGPRVFASVGRNRVPLVTGAARLLVVLRQRKETRMKRIKADWGGSEGGGSDDPRQSASIRVPFLPCGGFKTSLRVGGRVSSVADGPAISGPGLPIGQTRPPQSEVLKPPLVAGHEGSEDQRVKACEFVRSTSPSQPAGQPPIENQRPL